jgi:hypothetical protein
MSGANSAIQCFLRWPRAHSGRHCHSQLNRGAAHLEINFAVKSRSNGVPFLSPGTSLYPTRRTVPKGQILRYLEKGMGLMALTGRRPAEIFFSATFSIPRKKLPYPVLIFERPAQNPAGSRHQFRALPHPRPEGHCKTTETHYGTLHVCRYCRCSRDGICESHFQAIFGTTTREDGPVRVRVWWFRRERFACHCCSHANTC